LSFKLIFKNKPLTTMFSFRISFNYFKREFYKFECFTVFTINRFLPLLSIACIILSTLFRIISIVVYASLPLKCLTRSHVFGSAFNVLMIRCFLFEEIIWRLCFWLFEVRNFAKKSKRKSKIKENKKILRNSERKNQPKNFFFLRNSYLRIYVR
jgi:hypothetical protein